jgi:hypothetical protein
MGRTQEAHLSVWAQITKQVKALVTSGAVESFADGVDRVVQTDPALYHRDKQEGPHPI